MERRLGALILVFALLGGCDDDPTPDAGVRDAAVEARDAGRGDAGGDAGPATDAGRNDGGATDGGGSELDAGLDGGSGVDAATDADADAGVDAGSDAGLDGGPPPVTCTEPGLVVETIVDSASSGTPDSYFRDVRPGDPFCAEISGGGSGTWSVNVSNGTSSGLYCSGSTICRIRVPPGDTTLITTAVTTDIGSYTLRIHRIPP